MSWKHLVIYGSRGCGKTHNAGPLAAHFSCWPVFDGDYPSLAEIEPLTTRALILVTVPAMPEKYLSDPAHFKIVSFDEAMYQAGLTPWGGLPAAGPPNSNRIDPAIDDGLPQEVIRGR